MPHIRTISKSIMCDVCLDKQYGISLQYAIKRYG